MKLKIKKGAVVEVIAGSQKGQRGKVLAIDKAKLRIRVEGIKVMTHFDKKEGIQKKEAFLDYSNVKLVEQAATEAKKKTAKKKTAARKAT